MVDGIPEMDFLPLANDFLKVYEKLIKESKFFECSKDPEKTILHPIHGSNTAIINNLPEYSQLNLIVFEQKQSNLI